MYPSALVLPSLDTPTLAVARAVIQMTLAGLIIWTGSRRFQRAGAGWWAAGLALHGFALLAHPPRAEMSSIYRALRSLSGSR